MTVAVHDAPNTKDVADVPEPDPAPGPVKVRVGWGGRYGTDLHAATTMHVLAQP